GQLDFKLENAGAPVIVKAFYILTPGCSVNSWWPSTLPPNEQFHAPCSTSAGDWAEYRFRIGVRDRWGDHREYEMLLKFENTGRLDFWELPSNQTYAKLDHPA